MPAKLKIGDEVRLADSSIEISGEIVAFRDSEYVIVRWFGSKRTTHHVASLERIVFRKHELASVG